MPHLRHKAPWGGRAGSHAPLRAPLAVPCIARLNPARPPPRGGVGGVPAPQRPCDNSAVGRTQGARVRSKPFRSRESGMSIVIRDVREHELDSVLALNNAAGPAI